jgi:NADH dehydrogenase [ubiquinone] 1 alpha subcomplex assembly factor 7
LTAATPAPALTAEPERLDHFMARANAAYYSGRDPFADFTTAPEISPMFGEIIGARLHLRRDYIEWK